MTEIFAKPAVGAIIEAVIDGTRCLLIQERNKENGGVENGMTEIPAGKIRDYESIFDALRREVREETRLSLTHIQGQAQAVTFQTNGYETVSFQPFCVTQNLSGGYSLLLHTFLCRAEGELLPQTDETTHIRWEKAATVAAMLSDCPQQFYPLHINALKTYFERYPIS